MAIGPLEPLVAARYARYEPPPRLCVSDWLDTHRILPRGYPSPAQGPWRTSRTPYLREPFEATADPGVETVVLLFSSQIGKSEMLLGSLLYACGVDPGPAMIVLPTLELAAAMSTDRLAPALRSCDALAGKLGSPRSRSTDDAIHRKRVGDATITISGASSPASLAARPVRWLCCDEIDLWPAGTNEGDPLAQAIQRTAAFRRRKIIMASTPTIKGASRIEDWYEQSDKRKLWAPCPRCGERFVVEWHHVRWESGRPETAHIECPSCKGSIEDSERAAMFAAAEWKATKPEVKKIRGYRAWAVVSPWRRLPEIVEAFLEAKKQPHTLKEWINLTRGESWEEPGEKVETNTLLARAEPGDWLAALPARVRVLTCGVDTQDDRLEVLVVGWGMGEESWLVSRELFPGDPANPHVWKELDETLERKWPHEDGGALSIVCTLVDAAGHKTDGVYQAVRARHHRRVFASFGRSGGEKGMLVSPPKQLKTSFGPVIRYILDVDALKALIHGRLRIPARQGSGTIHIPTLGAESLVNELTAEVLRTERNKYGVPSKKWIPIRDRNETLDCLGMALGALRVMAPTPGGFARLAEMAAAKEGAEPKPSERRVKRWSPPQ